MHVRNQVVSNLNKIQKYLIKLETRKHLDHILKIHRGEITIKMEDEDMADNDNVGNEYDNY